MNPQPKTMVWAIDPVHTKIRFEIRYLSLSSVSGWFTELEGTVLTTRKDFSDVKITLTIFTNSLFTANSERDTFLKSPEVLDTEANPEAVFRSCSTYSDEKYITLKGPLTIKNNTQNCTFKVKYLGTAFDPMHNIKAGFEMDAVIDRKDFDITWNQYIDKQGFIISDLVSIHCDMQLLRIS